MQTQVCNKCNQEKIAAEFVKNKNCKNGIERICKNCRASYMRSYQEEKCEELSLKRKEYYTKNKATLGEWSRKYRQDNKDLVLTRKKEWYLKNKDNLVGKRKKERPVKRKYESEKYCTDAQYRIAKVLRARLVHALSGRAKNGSAIRDLGCTIQELLEILDQDCLRKYGELYSTAPKGKYHIDHRRPLASFDLNDPEQLRQAVHHTNLQVLLAKENLSKGAKHVD